METQFRNEAVLLKEESACKNKGNKNNRVSLSLTNISASRLKSTFQERGTERSCKRSVRGGVKPNKFSESWNHFVPLS